MKKWTTFNTGNKNDDQLNDTVSKLIVECLGNCLFEYLKIKSRRRRTELIMNALSRLGKSQNYKSMSRGISSSLKKDKFKKTEWLYDLHWYQEKDPPRYQQISLPLVVECEWDWKRRGDKDKDVYSAIKWDFQKLLVANADLRVMIYKKRSENHSAIENEKLDKYFDDAINGYRNLAEGSKFLIIAFNKTGFQYNLKIKPPSTS